MEISVKITVLKYPICGKSEKNICFDMAQSCTPCTFPKDTGGLVASISDAACVCMPGIIDIMPSDNIYLTPFL